jgi:hypothetical protein
MVQPSPRPPEFGGFEEVPDVSEVSKQSGLRANSVTDPLIQPPPVPPDNKGSYEGEAIISDFWISTEKIVIPAGAKSFPVAIYPREALAAELESRQELTAKEREMGLLPRSNSGAKNKVKNELMAEILKKQPGGVARPNPEDYMNNCCQLTLKQKDLKNKDLFQDEFRGCQPICKGTTCTLAWESKPVYMIFDNTTKSPKTIERFQPVAVGRFFLGYKCKADDKMVFGAEDKAGDNETLRRAERKIVHLRKMREKIEEADETGVELTQEKTQALFDDAVEDFNNDPQEYLTAVETYSKFKKDEDIRHQELDEIYQYSVDAAVNSIRAGKAIQRDLEAIQTLKGDHLTELNARIKELKDDEKQFEDNSWTQNACVKFDQLDEAIIEDEVVIEYDDDGLKIVSVPTVAEKLARAISLAKENVMAREGGLKCVRSGGVETIVDDVESELLEKVAEAHVLEEDSRARAKTAHELKLSLAEAVKSSRTLVREITNPFGFYSEIDQEEWDLGLEQKIDKADLSVEEKLKMRELFLEYFDVFRKANTFRPANYVEVNIPIPESAPPIIAKGGRHSQEHYQIIYDHFEKLIAADVVEVSTSPWASPIVVAPKRDNEGNWTLHRLCINYRRINELLDIPQTDFDDIWDTVQAPGTCKFISSFDIASAFHQCALAEKSKKFTAFLCPGHGLLQYRTMPFGIAVASNVFVMTMNKVFEGLKGRFMNNIIDDLVVYSDSFQDHLDHLRQIFKRCRMYNLTLAANKVQLCLEKLEFCGLIISRSGTEKDPRKTEAVKDWAVPTNVSEVRSWLGFCGFYRNFIKDFAKIAAPLHDMTKLENTAPPAFRARWGNDQVQAFENLKSAMLEDVVLDRPDPKKKFIVSTDWSKHGIGAVLAQVDDEGRERPVAFLSKKLTGAQTRYDATSGEALAVLYAFEKWRSFLYGQHFILYTDHSALKEIFFKSEPKSDKLTRWANRLLAFDFEVRHRAGRANANADELSRAVSAIHGDDFEPTESNTSESKNGDIEDCEPADALSVAKSNSLKIEEPEVDELFEEFVHYDANKELRVGWLNCGSINIQELERYDGSLHTTGILRSAREAVVASNKQRSVVLMGSYRPFREQLDPRKLGLARSKLMAKLVGPEREEDGTRRVDLLVIGSEALQEGWLPTGNGNNQEVPAVKIAETLRKHFGLKHVVLERSDPSFKQGVKRSQRIMEDMFEITVEQLRRVGFKGTTTVVSEEGMNEKTVFVGNVKGFRPKGRGQPFNSLQQILDGIRMQIEEGKVTLDDDMVVDSSPTSVLSKRKKPAHAGEQSLTTVARALARVVKVSLRSNRIEKVIEESEKPLQLPTKEMIINEQNKCDELNAVMVYMVAKKEKKEDQASLNTAKDVIANKKLKELFFQVPRKFQGLVNKGLLLLDNEGILYFRRRNESLSRHLIVLPKTLQSRVLSACHDYEGHCGRDRTLAKLRQLYWWKSQYSDVQQYVINCDKCVQLAMPEDNLTGFTDGWTAKNIFANWCIDIQGPFPASRGEGFRFAFNMVDPISRWLETVYLQDCNSYGVAHAIVMQLVSRFGRIENVFCDQGSEFVNNYFKDAMKLCGIKMTFASPHNHQAMGAVENVHRTIDKQIKNHLKDSNDHSSWAIAHAITRFGLNTSKIDKLNYSPYELVFGMRPQTEMSLALQPRDSVTEVFDEDKIKTEIERFLKGRTEVLTSIRNVAQQHHEMALHETNLNLLNIERIPIQVKVGDNVAKKVFSIQGNKKNRLASKLSWSASGPWLVEEILGESILKLSKVGGNGAIFTAPSRHCSKWPEDNGSVLVNHPTYDIMKRLFEDKGPSESGFRSAVPKGKTDEISKAQQERTRKGNFERKRDINTNSEDEEQMKKALKDQELVIQELTDGKDCMITYSKEKGLRLHRVFETTCFGARLRLHVQELAFMFVDGKQLTEVALREMKSENEVSAFISREKFSPLRTMPKWDRVDGGTAVLSEKQPDGTVPRERVITLKDSVTSFFTLEAETLNITFGGLLRNDVIRRVPTNAWKEIKEHKSVNPKLRHAIGYQTMTTDTRQRALYEAALQKPGSQESRDLEELAAAIREQEKISFTKWKNRKVAMKEITNEDYAYGAKKATKRNN